jgi:hypothetical protein
MAPKMSMTEFMISEIKSSNGTDKHFIHRWFSQFKIVADHDKILSALENNSALNSGEGFEKAKKAILDQKAEAEAKAKDNKKDRNLLDALILVITRIGRYVKDDDGRRILTIACQAIQARTSEEVEEAIKNLSK